ncbi:MAG: rhomboid family intramembrane serine protease [Burkholderiales bacterium]|jgi:membrane associated rhomboid family serine protease|nr:rhomboid family intramembrane serine protease [Burkholderiales bacterium]
MTPGPAAAPAPVEFRTIPLLPGSRLALRGLGTIASAESGLLIDGENRGIVGSQPVRVEVPFARVLGARRDGGRLRMVIRTGRTPFGRRVVAARFADDGTAVRFAKALDAAGVPGESGGVALADVDVRALLLHPRAPITALLLALNVAMFVVMAIAGAGILVPQADVPIRWGSNFGPLTTGGEWWRLASSTFIHFGVVHLAVNLLALWDAGRLVERLYGSAHFLVLYLASGIAGALASVAWNPWVNSAGASGAIFGVFGALLAYLFDRRNGVPPAAMRSHAIVTGLFLAYSLAYGFAGTNIDNAAHLGGLAAGFGLGFMLALPLAGGRPAWRPASVGAAAVAFVSAIAIGLQFVRDTGPAYRAELQFKAALDNAIAEGKRMDAAGETSKGAFQRFRRGEISRAELIRAVEEEAQFHEREIALFRAMSLDPESPSGWSKVRDTLVASLELRRDALRLAAQSIRDGDPDLMKLADRKMAEANALVKNARAAQEARRGSGKP